MNRKLLMLAGIALLAGGSVGTAQPTTSTQAVAPTAPAAGCTTTTSTQAVAPTAPAAGSTSSDVKSPTSTDVRSPTNTSTQAHTSDNVTVTGGAGAGNTSVNHYRPDGTADGAAAGNTSINHYRPDGTADGAAAGNTYDHSAIAD